MNYIFYFFVLLTPIFACYWLISLCLVTVVGRMGGAKGFLEFLRLWLKPLFWMNFIYFLAFEVVFSAVYWTGYILAATIRLPSPLDLLGRTFAPLYNALYRLVPIVGGDDGGVGAWIFISISIYLVIMLPYTFVHLRTTAFFKKLMVVELCRSYGMPSGKFISQSPNQMLPSDMVCRISAADEAAREWMIAALTERQAEFEGDPRKFSLSATNADHMQWELDGRLIDFWESQISIEKKKPYRDKEDELAYKSESEICFDGVVIRVNDCLPPDWSPGLYSANGEPGKGCRAEHKKGLLIDFIEILGRGSGRHQNEENSSADDFPASIAELDISQPDSLRFVGVDELSLYLFAETGLDGTMFDFNMNVKVDRSRDLYREDLEFVLRHCALADRVRASLDCVPSKIVIQTAVGS